MKAQKDLLVHNNLIEINSIGLIQNEKFEQKNEN
jgi:hypothetical protein